MRRKMKRKKKPEVKEKMRRKKKEPEMKRKVKPDPEPEPKKVLYPGIFVRKDGQPNCFVCHKILHDLREFREMTGTSQEYGDFWHKLKNKVSATLVMLPAMGRVQPLYRHATCEPGSHNWNKNTYLSKISKRHEQEGF